MQNNTYIGYIDANIKIYKNEINDYIFDISNNKNCDLSILKALNDNLHLIELLKNKRLLDKYKEEIIDKNNIINDYVVQKQQDIQHTKQYIIDKQNEINKYNLDIDFLLTKNKEYENKQIELLTLNKEQEKKQIDLELKTKEQEIIINKLSIEANKPIEVNKSVETNPIEIDDYIKVIDKYYSTLLENIDNCDKKIIKYNEKILNINQLKEKYNNSINELEKIPSLHIESSSDDKDSSDDKSNLENNIISEDDDKSIEKDNKIESKPDENIIINE